MSKHNNRAAFGGAAISSYEFARPRGIRGDVVIGTMSSEGDVWESRAMWSASARALSAALADALGVELHPPGTAERLATQPEPAATLDVSGIPELAGLTPEQVEAVRADLAWFSCSSDARETVWRLRDQLIERDNNSRPVLSARGREVLAALQAQLAPAPRRVPAASEPVSVIMLHTEEPPLVLLNRDEENVVLTPEAAIALQRDLGDELYEAGLMPDESPGLWRCPTCEREWPLLIAAEDCCGRGRLGWRDACGEDGQTLPDRATTIAALSEPVRNARDVWGSATVPLRTLRDALVLLAHDAEEAATHDDQ